MPYDTPYDTILVDDRAQVRTITLNRPERLNAVTDQLADEGSSAATDASRHRHDNCVFPDDSVCCDGAEPVGVLMGHVGGRTGMG